MVGKLRLLPFHHRLTHRCELTALRGSRPSPGYPAALHGDPSISLLGMVQGLLLDTLLLCAGILQSHCFVRFKAFSWIPCCFAQESFNLAALHGSRLSPGYPAALRGNPPIFTNRTYRAIRLQRWPLISCTLGRQMAMVHNDTISGEGRVALATSSLPS